MITFYMTRKMAIKRSLAHWRRMIVWAMTQNPEDDTNFINMVVAIGEKPNAEYCALCEKYTSCRFCPLARRYTCLDYNSTFAKLKRTNTWGEWIPIAITLAAEIESLLYIK